MVKVLVLNRTVTQEECPWLDADLPEGTTVWSYTGYDYGVISPNGIAVTAKQRRHHSLKFLGIL
jgi:hypothetical protein